MAWLPRTELPARANISQQELLDWLRYKAIAFGAPQLFIDAIDSLYDVVNQDEEIYELTKQRDALYDALEDLLADSMNEKYVQTARKVTDECR